MGTLKISRRLSDKQLAHIVLAVAMAASAGLTLWLLRGTTFTLDEVGYLVLRRGWDPHTLIDPHNGHLIVTNLLLVKPLLELFGSAHLPMTVLAVLAEITVGGLVFALARRRVGDLGALLPATLVLFLGAGWEVMMSPSGLCNQLALIGGLAMLLCLERGDSRGDVGAMIFLGVSLASHTLGLAFAAGAVVEILLRDGRVGWRRLWIVGVPVALFAIWWLWSLRFDGVDSSGYARGALLSGAFDQLASDLAAITGLFKERGSPELIQSLVVVKGERAVPLVYILIAAVAARAWLGPRPAGRTWAVLAILIGYLVLVGLGLSAARPPDASRYVYTGAVLTLLLIVQLCDGLRIARAWAIAAGALVAISLVANVSQMTSAGTFFREESAYNRAEMAALDLGRECIPGSYVPETAVTTLLPHRDLNFSADQYYAMTDEYGSPGYSATELAAAPAPAREAAETVFREALGRQVPVGTTPLRGAALPCPAASPPGRR
jgi:hypothetical protein